MILKTDRANFLILFLVNDFQKYVCKNFYVMFLAIMYVLHLEKNKMQNIKKHDISQPRGCLEDAQWLHMYR